MKRRASTNHSLAYKLLHRETLGYFPGRSTAPGALFHKFPGRLAFCLKDIVPSPNVLNNHVFLGFSKCGQFVISYTQTTEFDETSCTVYMQYRYRLHWWAFAPHQRLRKVSEVTLFGEQTVENRLFLAVCYWPAEDDRLVVYGRSERLEEGAQGSRCFLTVTAVPSLSGCHDCGRVAESYGEDDLAESWNSCVRFSCLRHGATVHTSFELVSPYPTFQPRLSLRRRGAVVINTGNFLHVVSACQTAAPPVEPMPPSADSADDISCGESDRLSLSGLEVDVGDEAPHTPASVTPGGFLWRYEPVRVPAGLPWRFDPRSPRADDCRLRSPRPAPPPPPAVPESRPVSPTESETVVTPPRRAAGRGWRRGLPAVRQANISADEYEFSEDGSDTPAHRENFSLFRKKRLADKKYEFSDENSENVPRFFAPARTPSSGVVPDGPCLVPVSDALLSPAGGINSKRRLLEDAEERRSADGDAVLRTISCNTEPELFVGPESDCESEVSSLLTASPRPPDRCRPPVVPPPPAPGACCVMLHRRYVEVDDELVSVTTDVEEDELSRSTGYHYALPLEVHGSGYSQMQMVTHAKADKLLLPGVSVCQLSLDVEQFCHEISQRLCAEAGKKYWFCNDYDVEIIEVHPDSGLVIAVAVVLVQAAVKMKGAAKATRRSPAGAVHRCQYRASFTFSWSMDTGVYTLLAWEPLTEVADPRELRPAGGGQPWQPARLLAAGLREPRPLPLHPYGVVYVLTNQAALAGTSLKAIVDPFNMVALLRTPQRPAAEEETR